MIIKNNDLLKSNYSEKKAMEARRKYMATGQISDDEWALVDQYSWLTYIMEGTNSNKDKQEVFNKELTITLNLPLSSCPPGIYLDKITISLLSNSLNISGNRLTT